MDHDADVNVRLVGYIELKMVLLALLGDDHPEYWHAILKHSGLPKGWKKWNYRLLTTNRITIEIICDLGIKL